jgi:hypothetical protein
MATSSSGTQAKKKIHLAEDSPKISSFIHVYSIFSYLTKSLFIKISVLTRVIAYYKIKQNKKAVFRSLFISVDPYQRPYTARYKIQ